MKENTIVLTECQREVGHERRQGGNVEGMQALRCRQI